MSDLNAKVVADLKRELAEAKAELAQERERANSGDWVEKAHAETLDAACKELESKLEAARVEIEQQRTRAEAAEQELREQHAAYIAPMSDKLAAIRAHLAGVDVAKMAALVGVLPDAPWEVFDRGDWWRVVRPKSQKDRWDYEREVFDDGSACGKYGPSVSEATRDGIVALRNAAGALLAAAREALEP